MPYTKHEKNKEGAISWLSFGVKALTYFGIGLGYVIVLSLKFIGYILSFIDHHEETSNYDIGGHYNILSGDFDSVKQYDGIYDRND